MNELDNPLGELNKEYAEIIFFLFISGFVKFRVKSACHDFIRSRSR